jgi:hypothetical protein
MKTFEKIIAGLERKIEQLNKERLNGEGFRLPKAKITLLGQFSLIVNPKISAQLNIPATMDVDAKIEADHTIKKAFIEILKAEGLEYDEDSGLIWIPKGSTFETLHESPHLTIAAITPIYGILSKAIKAKEKNRILVRDAMTIFGEKLVKLIVQNGGDPEYFLKD